MTGYGATLMFCRDVREFIVGSIDYEVTPYSEHY
jgi:hypothetical protein